MKNFSHLPVQDDIIKQAFEQIIALQSKNHSSQIENVICYLENRGLKNGDIQIVEDLLTMMESIFWCIDDVIDGQYDSSSAIIANEIVKFISFLSIFEQLFKYQQTKLDDFIMLLFGTPFTVQRIMKSINSNVADLVKIPLLEEAVKTEIEVGNGKDIINNLIISNQLNRAQNLKIYLGIAESFFKINIDYSPFLYFRALQLINEDIADRQKDSKSGGNNCYNILAEKHFNHQQIIFRLRSIAERMVKEIKAGMDKNSEFLLEKAFVEMHKLVVIEKPKIIMKQKV